MLSNWFRRMNLQTKFILLFLFLLVIVLCSFLAYVHWFVIQPLKESSENEQKLITHTISNQIDELSQVRIRCPSASYPTNRYSKCCP